MRIAVIGPAPPLRGGIASHTAGLHDALSDAGHSSCVLSYTRTYPRLVFPGTSERGDGRGLGAAMLDTMSPSSWRRGAAWLAARDCDAILVQWWNPIAAPALVRCLDACDGAPVVFICHNARPHERFPGWRTLSRGALARAAGVLCHSAAVWAELEPAVRRLPAEVCPMPLLIELAGRLPSRCEARRRLRLGRHDPICLFLGHARAYKGIDHLLAAWRRASLPPRARLVIAGESYLGSGALERRLARLGGCPAVDLIDRFLGEDEVRALLAAADVLVLPYTRASQSGTLPLALAAGLRVVASDAGGLAEGLAGRSGHRVYRAGDDAALAAALEASLARRHAGPYDDGHGTDDAPRHRLPEATCDTGAGPPARLASWKPTVRACERLVIACRGLEPGAAGPKG
jgi:glycosyltransferase involved in cell wall biosynthesis